MLGGCGPGTEPRAINISSVLPEPRRFHEIGNEYKRRFPQEVINRDLEQRVFEDFSDDGGPIPVCPGLVFLSVQV
jgi:hypothetical protein